MGICRILSPAYSHGQTRQQFCDLKPRQIVRGYVCVRVCVLCSVVWWLQTQWVHRFTGTEYYELNIVSKLVHKYPSKIVRICFRINVTFYIGIELAWLYAAENIVFKTLLHFYMLTLSL